MSLDVFRAVVQGYSDRVFDMQMLAVHQGYWSGYYNRSKKPKSLESILQKLLKSKEKYNNRNKGDKPLDDVDVEAFLAKEQMRLSQMRI